MIKIEKDADIKIVISKLKQDAQFLVQKWRKFGKTDYRASFNRDMNWKYWMDIRLYKPLFKKFFVLKISSFSISEEIIILYAEEKEFPELLDLKNTIEQSIRARIDRLDAKMRRTLGLRGHHNDA